MGLDGSGNDDFIQNISNEEWEEIGRDISNNTHLEELYLYGGALNDDRISFLFRGLTRSSSIKELWLSNNELSVAAVRSIVPFVQNANNLKLLRICDNNIQSEGFNFLLRALRDSPIEELSCGSCGIESTEIDTGHFPRHLKLLSLSDNNITADGCRGIAQLLQGGDSTLEHLFLNNNKIGDEGVSILVDALRSNKSLKYLGLMWNDGITKEGLLMLLKLVNDISSVKATLVSHQALTSIRVLDKYPTGANEDIRIQQYIDMATNINEYCDNPEAASREKIIQTQLYSAKRAALAELQGVSHSVYSEINPLHLPEVLALVGRRHGHDELFAALKSSIAGVISIVNRRRCIMQQLAYHEARLAQELAHYLANVNKLRTELGGIDAGEGDAAHVGNEGCNKRRRKR